ncbi:MAG: cytochrome c [Crocinitomicaceae bacterium]|nr:cytochrome c [Crocinitomicaceae bacterium]
MVLKIVVFISGMLLISSCTQGEISTVKKDDPNVEVDGRLLYINQCASCHGPKGNLGNSGSKDLSKSKLNEAQVLKIIKKGKGTMPPFEYLLTTDKEREAVVQFVMSLRKEEN